MKTWTREGYEVVEVAFDHDLHQFEIIQDGITLYTITPADLENQAQITADLDTGEDVNGWEDGSGNTIYVERKVSPLLEYVDAAWLSRRLGTSKQNIGKSARNALKEGYRGYFPRPDALVEGRPLWLKSRFGIED